MLSISTICPGPSGREISCQEQELQQSIMAESLTSILPPILTVCCSHLPNFSVLPFPFLQNWDDSITFLMGLFTVNNKCKVHGSCLACSKHSVTINYYYYFSLIANGYLLFDVSQNLITEADTMSIME